MTTPCTTPELPVLGCPLPGASPAPPPTPAASPPHPVAVTPTPTTAEVVSAPAEPVAVLPTMPPYQPALVAASPSLASPILPAAVVSGPSTAPPVAATPLSGVIASSFALIVFALLAVALLVSFLSGLRPATSPHSPSYGGTMKTRNRLWTGLGVLGLAALVGGIGWYRVAGEPLLNRQIPFLASAGIAVVVLAVLGASLIVAEQLRTDQDRIGDLEDAVRALTSAVSPLVEQPVRRQEPNVA